MDGHCVPTKDITVRDDPTGPNFPLHKAIKPALHCNGEKYAFPIDFLRRNGLVEKSIGFSVEVSVLNLVQFRAPKTLTMETVTRHVRCSF